MDRPWSNLLQRHLSLPEHCHKPSATTWSEGVEGVSNASRGFSGLCDPHGGAGLVGGTPKRTEGESGVISGTKRA